MFVIRSSVESDPFGKYKLKLRAEGKTQNKLIDYVQKGMNEQVWHSIRRH